MLGGMSKLFEVYEFLEFSLLKSPCLKNLYVLSDMTRRIAYRGTNFGKNCAVGINLLSFSLFVAIINFCQHFLKILSKTNYIAWSYRNLLLSKAVWSSFFLAGFYL